MSVVVHITSEEQEEKYFELFYKLYPKATRPSTRSYWYKYDKDVGFNMNNGNSFSVAGWSHYRRTAKQYDYELIEFDEFLKRFDPEFKSLPQFVSVKGGREFVELCRKHTFTLTLLSSGRVNGCDANWFYNLDLSDKICNSETKIAKYHVVTVKELEQMLFEHQLELVEPQPKFRVGDRCKIIDTKDHFYSIGTFVVIKKPKSESGNYGVQEDGGTLYQLVHELQLEPCLAAQEEIVEITELNAEQYYGRVGKVIKLHPNTTRTLANFPNDVQIISKNFAGNLDLLDVKTGEGSSNWMSEKQGVTIKFTDNKQLNQQTMKSKEEIYEAMQAEWLRITGLKVGDYVKVTRKAEDHEQGWINSWAYSEMKVGRTLKISYIHGAYGIRLDGYNYPYFVLEPVEAPEKNYKLEDASRTVTIKEDGSIECGCLKLTKANAVQALKIMKDLHQIFSDYTVAIKIQGSSIDSNDLTALTKLIK